MPRPVSLESFSSISGSWIRDRHSAEPLIRYQSSFFFSSTLTSSDIVDIHNIARFPQPTLAGCNVIVAGTSVFKAPSPKEAISSLRKAVDEAWVGKLKTGQWDQ